MLTEEGLQAIRERAAKGFNAIVEVAKDPHNFRMSIPAREDDTDRLLVKITDDIPHLCDEVERLRVLVTDCGLNPDLPIPPPKLHSLQQHIGTLEDSLSRLREIERKGMQLCQLIGPMMLVCQKLRPIQERHAETAGVRRSAMNPTGKCYCEICALNLPDLSDEAIDKLVAESNVSYAELSRLRTERDELREVLRDLVQVETEEADSGLVVVAIDKARDILGGAEGEGKGHNG